MAGGSKGKTRMLGIPTVVDRVIQQSRAQVLSLVYEPKFSATSYGFRPRRNAHKALQKAQDIINDGYCYCVDLDLEKFFDTINHIKLIQLLGETIKDGKVISLIHKYLNAGIMVVHKYKDSPQGLPHRDPLSPILSNIMLTELDRKLERQGVPLFVMLMTVSSFRKSLRPAERVCENITKIIEGKIFLKVNIEKTHVGSVNGQTFLDYSFNMRR